jgi:hypothetical protein
MQQPTRRRFLEGAGALGALSALGAAGCGRSDRSIAPTQNAPKSTSTSTHADPSCPPADQYPTELSGLLASLDWNFGATGIDSLTVSFIVSSYQPASSQLYFISGDNFVDGTPDADNQTLQYHGIQTLGHDNTYTTPGAMFIFSRFGTLDTRDVDPAPGSYAYADNNEGNFISLRCRPAGNTALRPGLYRTTLRRLPDSATSDWLHFSVQYDNERPRDIGKIRFHRAQAGVPVSLAPIFSSSVENFGATFVPVPKCTVEVSAVADGSRVADSVRVAYSSDNRPAMPDSKVTRIRRTDKLLITMGPGVQRCAPEGTPLWTAPPIGPSAFDMSRATSGGVRDLNAL